MSVVVPAEPISVGEIVLRPWIAADVPVLLAAVRESREHLKPWMPWAASPPDDDEERQFVAASIEGWSAGREFVYGIFLREGQVVGGCGLHRREGPDALEIGYWIHVRHVGRGYATLAAATLTEIAFGIPGIERTFIRCDEANLRSAAVPVKLGYRLVATEPREPQAPAETGRGLVWTMEKERFASSAAAALLAQMRTGRSIRVVTGVAARDAFGRILLVRRTDDATWCLPGGGLEPGETWRECAEREFREETGETVAVTGLLGVYSDPTSQIHRYASGKEVHFVGVCFEGLVASEDLRAGRDPGPEVSAVGYFSAEDLPANIFEPDRPVISDAFCSEPRPFVR